MYFNYKFTHNFYLLPPPFPTESIDINIDTLTIDWPTSLIIHDGGIANVFLCIFLSTTEGADVINAISTDLERYEITTWLSIDAQGNGPVATTKGNILKKFQVQPLINGEQFMMAEVYRLTRDCL